MNVLEIVAQARDSMTVKRVYGDPYEKDGVTIIPAAKVAGGGGGGGDAQSNGGGGFGLSARPVGAFVIKDREVSWRPVVDVTRIVVGCQIVAVIALFVLARRKS